jgi:hypothetical protein
MFMHSLDRPHLIPNEPFNGLGLIQTRAQNIDGVGRDGALAPSAPRSAAQRKASIMP